LMRCVLLLLSYARQLNHIQVGRGNPRLIALSQLMAK
jgi:hypothetical protein